MLESVRHTPLSVLGTIDVLGDARVCVRELPFLGHLLLRFKGASPTPDLSQLAALEAATGLQLPRVGGCVAGASPTALRLSASRWLVLTEADANAAWCRRIEAALPSGMAVFDVTEAFDTLAVEGPCARDLLCASCPLDLHDAAFPVGAVASSSLAQVGIVLRRTGTLQYMLHADASDASHLWRWLQVSIDEFKE